VTLACWVVAAYFDSHDGDMESHPRHPTLRLHAVQAFACMHAYPSLVTKFVEGLYNNNIYTYIHTLACMAPPTSSSTSTLPYNVRRQSDYIHAQWSHWACVRYGHVSNLWNQLTSIKPCPGAKVSPRVHCCDTPRSGRNVLFG